MTFDWTISVPVILSIATIVFTYFRTRRADVEERFTKLAEESTRIKERVGALEETVRGMPGKDDVHQLHLMLAEMGGDMKAMRATMRGMAESLTRTENIVSRHEDHLRGTS